MALSVGIIGVGQMGMAMARNLIERGINVVGCDPNENNLAILESIGGTIASHPADLAKQVNYIITSIPKFDILTEIISGPNGIINSAKKGTIIIETSTFSIKDKEIAKDILMARDITILDCPISGTPPMVAARKAVIYASGDKDAYEECKMIFEAIADINILVGDFGAGSKLKIIANHLVIIHTCVAAEALAFAESLGLDPVITQQLISQSAGSSRMFEVRGKMMVEGDYTSTGGNYQIATKDGSIIAHQAEDIGSPVPLLQTSLALYAEGIEKGFGEVDAASLYEVYKSNQTGSRD